MGSSPVTATIHHPPPPGSAAALLSALRRTFTVEAPAGGAPLLVAFSGGPDSCALLWGLRELAGELGYTLHAAHFDHRMDPGSGARAESSRTLAAELGVPWHSGAAPAAGPIPGESREAGARRLRYTFLEQQRRRLGARWVATGHHLDDQVETVLLRLTQGSGAAGLAGMATRAGTVVRPLLSLGREEIAKALSGSGLEPVQDPTNRDLAVPRNRLRHAVIPHLPGDLQDRCSSLASAAAGARRRIEGWLEALLPPPSVAEPALPLRELSRLPPPLLPWALARLHRQHGLPYPPRRRAALELARQLQAGSTPRCDCGDGWQWRGEGELLTLRPQAVPTASFAYTLEVPGEVELAAAGGLLRLSRQPVAPWMWQGSARRAALDLPLEPGQAVTVRNRRPGDRLQPLGCGHRRRLKEVLIDRKMPRGERDLLPLLCLEGQVAWVPGVTIHHPFRLRRGTRIAWVAELV